MPGYPCCCGAVARSPFVQIIPPFLNESYRLGSSCDLYWEGSVHEGQEFCAQHTEFSGEDCTIYSYHWDFANDTLYCYTRNISTGIDSEEPLWTATSLGGFLNIGTLGASFWGVDAITGDGALPAVFKSNGEAFAIHGHHVDDVTGTYGGDAIGTPLELRNLDDGTLINRGIATLDSDEPFVWIITRDDESVFALQANLTFIGNTCGDTSPGSLTQTALFDLQAGGFPQAWDRTSVDVNFAAAENVCAVGRMYIASDPVEDSGVVCRLAEITPLGGRFPLADCEAGFTSSYCEYIYVVSYGVVYRYDPDAETIDIIVDCSGESIPGGYVVRDTFEGGEYNELDEPTACESPCDGSDGGAEICCPDPAEQVTWTLLADSSKPSYVDDECYDVGGYLGDCEFATFTCDNDGAGGGHDIWGYEVELDVDGAVCCDATGLSIDYELEHTGGPIPYGGASFEWCSEPMTHQVSEDPCIWQVWRCGRYCSPNGNLGGGRIYIVPSIGGEQVEEGEGGEFYVACQNVEAFLFAEAEYIPP